MSNTPKRSCARGRLETRKNLRHQPPGGPGVPTPPLVLGFQKLTHALGVRGAGRTGFPAGSPGGPAPAAPPTLAPQDRRAKGRPKDARPRRRLRVPSPPQPARPERGRGDTDTDTDTDTHHPALRGQRPRRPPRAPRFTESPSDNFVNFRSTCHFPKGHSSLGTGSLTSKGPQPSPGAASPATAGEGGKRPKAKQTTARGRGQETMPPHIRIKAEPTDSSKNKLRKEQGKRKGSK